MFATLAGMQDALSIWTAVGLSLLALILAVGVSVPGY